MPVIGFGIPIFQERPPGLLYTNIIFCCFLLILVSLDQKDKFQRVSNHLWQGEMTTS